MEKRHIVRLHHPSGRLFEAYAEFVAGHEHGSYFQSDAFFRFAATHQVLEPVLLVALKHHGLRDPGGRFKPWQADSGLSPAEALTASVDEDSIAGVLLAVVSGNEPNGLWRLGPLRPLHRRLCSRTLVVGGPLMAPGSRLEREYTLKALIQTLCSQAKCHASTSRFICLFDDSDQLPLFREMGFRWHEQTFPAGELIFREPEVITQVESLPEEMKKGFGSFVRR